MMKLKKILFSGYKDLSKREQKKSRLVIVIILLIFVFILPWVLMLIFFKQNLILEFKKEILIASLTIIAVYVRIAVALSNWVKRGPDN